MEEPKSKKLPSNLRVVLRFLGSTAAQALVQTFRSRIDFLALTIAHPAD